MDTELRVVATAGHVDHGKSALIQRLTGIDPDRWEEEKRRGLTIDLGYAWCTLPSGREIGFVDVPGHERFVGNMLAGVGPVPLVLFVVAADEGWRPQSEEHLQILDVLGVRGGVIALSKRDLVTDTRLSSAIAQVRDRLAGTALADAPVVPVSSVTGDGIDELCAALDRLLTSAPPPEVGRQRLFVDRAFTIKGAGTVVTGTLTGNCLSIGDAVELYPSERRARVRALQVHRATERRACPVGRVAANLVGVEVGHVSRGDVLASPDAWRPTAEFEARLRGVRGLAHPVTTRGAFKVHAGAAEVDARVRLYGTKQIGPSDEAFVRIRLARPLLLDVFDRFVLRESGRRETVGGGVVLDVGPPRRAGPDPERRLTARLEATRETLPMLLAAERGAVRADDALVLTGSGAQTASVGGWFVRDDLLGRVEPVVTDALASFHDDHPLAAGAEPAEMRRTLRAVLRSEGAPVDIELIEALTDELVRRGALVRRGSVVGLPGREVAIDRRSPEVGRLVDAVGADGGVAPPALSSLVDMGIPRDVIEAAARAGVVVRVSPELVFTPEAVARAERIVRESGPNGITVSAFRQALGTSRKYALPLLEWFDQHGVTRRQGDLRIPRSTGSG